MIGEEHAMQAFGLTQLLDELLVLVELLEVLHAHGVHAQSLGLLAMLVVTQHAHLEVGGGGIEVS